MELAESSTQPKAAAGCAMPPSHSPVAKQRDKDIKSPRGVHHKSKREDKAPCHITPSVVISRPFQKRFLFISRRTEENTSQSTVPSHQRYLLKQKKRLLCAAGEIPQTVGSRVRDTCIYNSLAVQPYCI